MLLGACTTKQNKNISIFWKFHNSNVKYFLQVSDSFKFRKSSDNFRNIEILDIPTINEVLASEILSNSKEPNIVINSRVRQLSTKSFLQDETEEAIVWESLVPEVIHCCRQQSYVFLCRMFWRKRKKNHYTLNGSCYTVLAKPSEVLCV